MHTDVSVYMLYVHMPMSTLLSCAVSLAGAQGGKRWPLRMHAGETARDEG